MRKAGWIWLLVAGLVLLPAAPSHAWHHGRGGVFIGVGPGWWGPPWWGPYPYWYPPYYPYYPPPQVIVEPPSNYVQQEPAPAAPPAYWYYCASAQGYYPQVQSCPEAWVKVAPRSP